MELLAERGSGRSICPSEVARHIFPAHEWREQMQVVRDVAQELIEAGLIEATQKGRVVKSALKARGPIRLRKATVD